MRRYISELTRMLLMVFIPLTAFLLVYDTVSNNQYEAFWERSPAALMLYGRMPEEKYLHAYATMSQRARAKGFVFTDPQLVSPNDLFNLWYVRWRRSPMIGVSNDGGRYLMIDPVWMVQFTDDELDCVLAHEIGHVIEFQGKSESHPVVRRVACLNRELRADGIAGFLCGSERFQTTLLRHIPPDALRIRQVGNKECAADPVK